jgi:recombinational DNA repair protein RecR
MPPPSEVSELTKAHELFDFLQGKPPPGYKISKKNQPKLTEDQAWTIIWFLGNQYWKVPDHIERCDMCGAIYDRNHSGDCLDYGRSPYHFCSSCVFTPTYHKKAMRNPDKSERPDRN